ncbi:cyclic AMP receptor-like protein A [Aplysia californica]|uniref:Cyclic AMP receptor-like protein A n=1 Tax=Aplysia californica TaxID=6500 RepID=A0ABM0JS98_APLCA|nr:cyclic AMP receptor-like protein A [Aplysia californica]
MPLNGSCISFPDNPSHCDAVVVARKVSGSLSLIGAIFMVFVIWLFKRYVAFSQRLTLYLSISSLLHSIGFLMGSRIDDGPFCDFQGWYITYFHWQVMLLVGCITFNLFMNVVRLTTTAKFEWVYVVICAAVPLVVSLLPFIDNVYGPSGSWCWIVEDTKWRIGIWYGPLFTFIIILIAVYGFIIFTLLRKASTWEGTYDPNTHRQHQLMKEDIKPLRFYPFVYLAVSVFSLINRIQNAISPDYHVFALVLLATMTSPLQGALNAIAFGIDKEILFKLRPSEILVAFKSKLAPGSTVQEYPQPDRDTDQLEIYVTTEA